MREQSLATPAGNLVHEDLPLTTRVLRDELRSEVRRVLVDSPGGFARMQEFARAFMPEFADRIELHEAPRPSSTCTAWKKRSAARWKRGYR